MVCPRPRNRFIYKSLPHLPDNGRTLTRLPTCYSASRLYMPGTTRQTFGMLPLIIPKRPCQRRSVTRRRWRPPDPVGGVPGRGEFRVGGRIWSYLQRRSEPDLIQVGLTVVPPTACPHSRRWTHPSVSVLDCVDSGLPVVQSSACRATSVCLTGPYLTTRPFSATPRQDASRRWY